MPADPSEALRPQERGPAGHSPTTTIPARALSAPTGRAPRQALPDGARRTPHARSSIRLRRTAASTSTVNTLLSRGWQRGAGAARDDVRRSASFPPTAIELTRRTPATALREARRLGLRLASSSPTATAWGLMAPVGANLARQLTPDQHDPAREIDSSKCTLATEAPRSYRRLARWSRSGGGRQRAAAPKPRATAYEPCCLAGGRDHPLAAARTRPRTLCEERVVLEARQHFAEARVIDDLKQLFREHVIPGASRRGVARTADSCNGGFAARLRPTCPTMSAQYALAIVDLRDVSTARRCRFRWGLIGV